MELPDKVQSLPAPLRTVWEKAYKMALKRFANDTAKAGKVADKAVAQAKAKMGKSQEDQSFEVSAEISKVDEDQGLVYGWFYTCKKGGEVVVDHSEESIDEYELEKAFVNYMLNSRAGGEMHVRKNAQDHAVATLVGGMVFTDETVTAMGLPDDTPRGGFGIFKVWDPVVLAKVKSGEYGMFSIGGSGKRKLLEDDFEKSAGSSAVVERIRQEISKAEAFDDLSDSSVAYLEIQATAAATEAVEKGVGPNRHGPSIKCPDIYEALRREGATKTKAAKISNECWKSPQCKCH